MIDRYRTSPVDEPSPQDPSTSSETSNGQAVWSLAAVRLLQGVIYQDENHSTWELLLANISELEDYFAKIGLQLVVDENDAMAYLRQTGDATTDDEEPDDLPRLFRRSQLGYEATLLCVLLRDLLQQFEEQDLQNERCVASEPQLAELWQEFFPSSSDQVKLRKALHLNLRKLEELRFIKQFEGDSPSWEIRRILKARLPISELERFKQALLAAKDGPEES